MYLRDLVVHDVCMAVAGVGLVDAFAPFVGGVFVIAATPFVGHRHLHYPN